MNINSLVVIITRPQKNCPFSQVLAPPNRKNLSLLPPLVSLAAFYFIPETDELFFLLFFLLDFTNALFYLDYTITF